LNGLIGNIFLFILNQPHSFIKEEKIGKIPIRMTNKVLIKIIKVKSRLTKKKKIKW